MTCPCCGATCNGNANDRKRFIRRHFGNEACHVVRRRELASAPTVRSIAEDDVAEMRARRDLGSVRRAVDAHARRRAEVRESYQDATAGGAFPDDFDLGGEG